MGSVRKNYSKSFQQVQDRFTGEVGKLFEKEHRCHWRNNRSGMHECGFHSGAVLRTLPHPVVVRYLPQLTTLPG